MNWKPPAHIRAIIFDCDGTLADTMPAHFVAWQRIMQELGIDFPEERFYRMGGMPTAGIIRTLAAEQNINIPDHELPRHVHRKEDFFLEAIDTIQPVRNVYQVAKAYRGRLPLAVASGGYRHIVGRTLEALECKDWFQAVVCAEDTEHHKPAPDVFLKAAQLLGTPAKECLVFEDTEIGLEAAARAGMLRIDIRTWNPNPI